MVVITSTRGDLVSPCVLGLLVVQIKQSFGHSVGHGEVLSSSDICRMSNMSNKNCLTFSRVLLVCLRSRNFLLVMISTFLDISFYFSLSEVSIMHRPSWMSTYFERHHNFASLTRCMVATVIFSSFVSM